MFTDEIYEEILINKEGKMTTAHAKVCEQKLGEKDFTTSLKQIENGYQLFRKKNTRNIPKTPSEGIALYRNPEAGFMLQPLKSSSHTSSGTSSLNI